MSKCWSNTWIWLPFMTGMTLAQTARAQRTAWLFKAVDKMISPHMHLCIFLNSCKFSEFNVTKSSFRDTTLRLLFRYHGVRCFSGVQFSPVIYWLCRLCRGVDLKCSECYFLPWNTSSVWLGLRQWQSGKLKSSVKFLLNSKCETP